MWYTFQNKKNLNHWNFTDIVSEMNDLKLSDVSLGSDFLERVTCKSSIFHKCKKMGAIAPTALTITTPLNLSKKETDPIEDR